MNKKIVMIGNTSWSMFQFRADLMRKFINTGNKVVVIAPKDEWSCSIQNLGIEFIELTVDRKGINPFKDVAYTFKLTQILLHVKADIVLSYTVKPVLYGTLAAWICRVPQRIAINTGLGYAFTHNNSVTKFIKILYSILLKFSTEVWFLNSDDLKSFVAQNLVGKHKTFLLPGEGVNIEHYVPIPVAQENKKTTFALIARMLWDKGIGLYVTVAEEIKKIHPNVIFLLIGPIDDGNPQGIPSSTLQRWNADGNIHYLGSIKDVRNILKDIDCLIHPTYYKEGLPRILIESNAMGIPCITTEVPGCRDVILNGINGFLVPPQDKEKLKEAIIKFMELHISIRKDISALARDRVVKHFSSERINSIYIERLFK